MGKSDFSEGYISRAPLTSVIPNRFSISFRDLSAIAKIILFAEHLTSFLRLFFSLYMCVGINQ